MREATIPDFVHDRKERTLTHIKYRVGKRLLRDVRAAMKRNNLACCISQTSMV